MFVASPTTMAPRPMRARRAASATSSLATARSAAPMARDTYIQKVVLNEGQNNLNLLVPLTRQPHRKEDAILVSHSFYFIYLCYL